MDALALERVQVAGQGGDQRLALAGPHLGDASLVQDHAADELHVVVAHLEHAPARLAAHGEGLDEDVVERGAVVELLLELGRLGLELGVGELLHLLFEGVDGLDPRPHPADGALVGGAEDLLDGPGQHRLPCEGLRGFCEAACPLAGRLGVCSLTVGT